MPIDPDFEDVLPPVDIAPPPPQPEDISPLRARASKRNGAIGCIVLVLVVGACLRAFAGDDPEPAPAVQPLAAPVATAEEATVEPTVEPADAATFTPEATATDAATETAAPTAAPTETPAPTAVPATAAPQFAYDPDPCSDLNCADFAGKSTDPQDWWNARKSDQCPNPGGLDGDNDGSVCEEGEGGVPGAQPVAPPPAQSSGCVNFNSASFDELRRITHVDDNIANQIIDLRGTRPFSGWGDLVDRVSGIGEKNVKDIQAQGLGCF